MTESRVTLADVARVAGVSRTTASFVLTGRTDMRISTDAQRRVLDAAAQLGYRPNLTARSLRTSVTRTIGLISDTIATTPYAGEVIRGALDTALKHDCLLFVAETGADRVAEERLIAEMVDRQVDGLVYAAMFTQHREPPESLRKRPTVLLNCVAESSDAPLVLPDEVEAGRTAARAVLEAGHKADIYVIGGRHTTPETPSGAYAGHERMRGIEEAFARAESEIGGVVECAWHGPEYGYEAVRDLLRSGRRPRALICMNDRLALGAYQVLQESGLTIPDDVSVVSFDDSDLASWLRPRLTSVALPHYELGKAAVDILLGNKLEAKIYRIPMPIRPRASVGPPATHVA